MLPRVFDLLQHLAVYAARQFVKKNFRDIAVFQVKGDSKVKQLRGAGTTPARIRGRQDTVSQTERKNRRTSPKDQFVK